jgi:acyl carrier protein
MICEDGHYYILGRRSDTVIGESGENINPDMIEKAFVLGDVKQFSVLGLPGKTGQELSMVVQVNPYTSWERIEKIKQEIYRINETFPQTIAVRSFYFTHDDLAPESAIKVSRAQLIKKIEGAQVTLIPFQQFVPGEAPEDIESPFLAPVKAIIARILEVDEAGISGETHIFYDLGATSIQYFSILAALAEEFSVSDYDSSDAFCYTPKEICEYLERKS